jgi:hypothetical protein
MIFKQIEQVLSGEKTQTRRVCKPGEAMVQFMEWVSREGEYIEGYCVADKTNRRKWVCGRTYAIQSKRGATGIDKRIKITAIRHERLHDITEADAVAEGVASVEIYKQLWDSINWKTKDRWANNPLVWVITFEVVR